MSWPARWAGGQRRTQACSLTDLAQTLMEITGAPCPEEYDGQSLLSWLDDADASWRDLAVSEYYGHFICSPMTMIRRRPWKYIYHAAVNDRYPAERELFHLGNDRDELQNLAHAPEHQDRMANLHAAMVKEVGRDPEEIAREWREVAVGENGF